MSQKGTKPKETAAQRRAQEAIDRVSRSSSEPTKRVLDFLLAGSHQTGATAPPISDGSVSPQGETREPIGLAPEEIPSQPVPTHPNPSRPSATQAVSS